jgi:helicase MOV-10
MFREIHETTHRFTAERPARNQVVSYGVDTTLNVTCTQSNRGRFEARVEVLFEDTQSNERFVIVRPVLVAVGNVEEHRALQPITPYVVPRRPRQQRQVAEVEGGVVSLSPPKKTWTVVDNAPHIFRPHLSKHPSHGNRVSNSTVSRRIFLLS